MDTVFYVAAVVAILATVRVITCLNAVHALLYLIVSLLSVAIVFYTLGAPFIAALEVIIYAGANDLAGGKKPELVFGDFVALATKIRENLPNARISLIASAPNPKRWGIVEKVKRFNSLAQEYCQAHGLTFIDVFPLMLGPNGSPKPDIFREDGLHMNANGYAIWKETVGPYLK